MAIPVLQRCLSLPQSWSISATQCRSITRSAQRISTSSATTRAANTLRIEYESRSWRAKVGREQVDSTEESATSVSSDQPPSSKSSSMITGAKGFGIPLKTVEKNKSAKGLSSSSIRRVPPSKPLIGVQSADQSALQIETALVTTIAVLFVVIFVEGLLLAASGFLPEEWDQFAVTFVYPAFSPTVGVFLAIAAGYGVWKYFGGAPGVNRK